ncbi:MAG: autotransporter-associated beta strand repeat-containing protein [Rariglobus sp.]
MKNSAHCLLPLRTASVWSFAFLTAFSSAPLAHAAALYWDSDATGAGNSVTAGTGLGGTGNWDTSLANWWSGAGTSDTAWTNGNNTAVFWGPTAGTVSLTAPITVGGLQFRTTDYTLDASANALTFGSASTIDLLRVATANITGAVGGTGSVSLLRSSDSAGVFTAGTLNLNGTSATGWSGATTVGNGTTLSLSGGNQALVNTSGITLNGGNLTLTNINGLEAALNRVNDSAAIISNGGSITVTNTSGGATAYAETLGGVALTTGQLKIVSTNANAGGTQVLTLGGLTQAGTSVVAFGAGGGLNTSTNQIVVAGASETAAGQIIGPWATVGTSGTAQTDYAVYDANGNVLAANITASAETAWASGATANNTLSGATTLTATRNMNSLRYTGGAATLALGTSNLETNGILNGGSGLLTISGGGVIQQQGTSAANFYVNAGNSAITINSVIVDNTGVLTLVKTGSGALTLGANNTFTGNTVVLEGAVTATVAGAVDGNLVVGSVGGGAAASFTNNGNTVGLSTRSVTIYSNGTVNFGGGAQNINSGIFIFGGAATGGNQLVVNNTAINMTGGSFAPNVAGNGFNNTFIINASSSTAVVSGNTRTNFGFQVADGAADVDLLFSGAVTTSGAGGALVKSGAGLMLVTGNNLYQGVTTVSGGTLKAGRATNAFGSNSAVTLFNTAGVLLDITGFDNAIGSLAGGGANGGNVALGAATLTTGGNNTSTSYDGVISGTGGGLTKTGSGTQTLTRANTYTGATTISAGTLALGLNGTIANSSGINLGTSGSRGTLDLTAKSSFAFGASQTLSGDGTVNIGGSKVVTVNGVLAPGNSAGGVNITGALVLGSTSISNLEIVSRNGGSPVAGTDFDQVAMTGAVTFNGTLNINTTGLAGLVGGESFQLFSAGGTYTSGFTSVIMTGAYTPTFSNAGGVWTGSNAGLDFTFTESNGTLSVSAVPEPSTFALIAGGFAAAAVALQRRKRVA